MSTVSPVQHAVPKLSTSAWLLVAIAAVVVAGFSQPGIAQMIETWFAREEYSHAIIIPFITAYLVWQKAGELADIEFTGSWLGVGIAVFGAIMQIAGALGTLYVVQQYGLLLTIYGLVLAFLGRRAVRRIWAPLLILAFMVPLPEFALQNLSAQLQLLSSQIGVWFIRMFGISVYVEGNVIDLGAYQLQVAEACNGLRYLFPLMTLGFIAAYMFNVAMWKRAVLFLSTIPITVLMNSFRIGTIGVMVEHWGTAMAEGFLHDFQGWVVFMASAALLLFEMMVLARIGRDARPWREVFGLETTTRKSAPLPFRGSTPVPFIASAVLVSGLTVAIVLMPQRAQAVPQREPFVSFPMQIDTWGGQRSPLDQIYLDALQLDDYIMSNYMRGSHDVVNFYVAWYDTQSAGQSAHSPRSCLPGGGWRIADLQQVTLPMSLGATPLRVNRVQIELGTQRQLVYYWFQQRGRIITNEYLVKWYLFWDSLTRQRSDGALVRLVTPLAVGESPESADRRLTEFAAQAVARLDRYIPN